MQHANPTWGLVATIKAPLGDVLRFAAYHLEIGAHRLSLYLDQDDPQTVEALKDHPGIEVFVCDQNYWRACNVPRFKKHQVRQSHNATRAYRRADVDWLAHIDVDEFIWSPTPLRKLLARLPRDCVGARLRPIEALSGSDSLFKAFIPAGPRRLQMTRAIYPRYGAFVKGGFMSHLAGKLLVRTGLPDIEFRIHNAFQSGQPVLPVQELEDADLCHLHGQTWKDWRARYRFRLRQGSYRPDLAPNVARAQGGLSMNELLSAIEDEAGEIGLRQFYDELSAVDPAVRERLDAHGMLRQRDLKLDSLVQKHFPSK